MTTCGRQDSPGKHAAGSIITKRIRGDTIINVLIVVLLLGLLAFGVMWIIKTMGEAGEQYATGLINTKVRASDVACQTNLRAIGQNLQMYAVSNDSFPAGQEEMVRLCGGARRFRCPDPNGGEYIYVPRQRGDMPDSSVVIYEAQPAHQGRCHVLFLGGEIASLTPEELQAALRATPAQRR